LVEIIAYSFTIILAVAFFTVFERKILAAMQRRRGPMLLVYMGYYSFC